MEETCSLNQYTQLRLQQWSTGSKPIPLPQGSKSSYTQHVCEALRIPPCQRLPKPAVSQGLSPPPQALHTSWPLLYSNVCVMHTYTSPGRQTSTIHIRLKISSHRSARGDSHLTHYLSQVIAFFLHWDRQKVAGCCSSEMPDLVHMEQWELKCLTFTPQAWYLKSEDLYLSLLFPKVIFRLQAVSISESIWHSCLAAS